MGHPTIRPCEPLVNEGSLRGASPFPGLPPAESGLLGALPVVAPHQEEEPGPDKQAANEGGGQLRASLGGIAIAAYNRW